VRIPGWDVLLDIAARSYELTGLGYIGIDLVLDREKGPLVLELNARPGLAIQLANRAGLAIRLEAARAEFTSLASVDERVHFAKERFGRA
jgi:D-alanine-D-alanine ligase-like ATP-grasp enzyme